MKMIDQELKAKWVKALRSGEYKQARTVLHDAENNSYCCLGVLCKVVGAEFLVFDDGDQFVENVPVLGTDLLKDGGGESLSDWYAEKIGIADAQQTLVELNDGEGHEGDEDHKPPQPFTVIADWIEENL